MIDRLRGVVALAASAVWLGGLACATAGAPHDGPTAPGVLSDVHIEKDGDATVVGLVGAQEAVYTSFQREDPARLIVDLPAVQASGLAESIPVDDGFVDAIGISAFSAGDEPMTRVVVELAGRAEYTVTPQPERLAIRISPAEPAALEPIEVVDDPAFEAWDDPWADAGAADDGAAEAEALAAAEAPAAATLTGVEIEEVDGVTLVRLRADGAIRGPDSFELEDPHRIVIDMPGMTNMVTVSSVEAATTQLDRIRIGQHADKVRVVLDARDTDGLGHALTTVADGLRVTLGAADAVAAEAMHEAPQEMAAAEETADAEPIDRADAEPADLGGADDAAMEAPAPMPEPEASPAAKGMRVSGVELESGAGTDRVRVRYDGELQYVVYRPDAETVVLSMVRAQLDPEAAVHIAPEPGGPVSLVTAFQQPDVDTPEVRVVVKRAADLAPEVVEEAGMLTLGFTGTGMAAATPPVIAAQRQASAMPAMAPHAQPGAGPDLAAAAQAAALSAAEPAALPAAIAPAAVSDSIGTQILQEGGLYEGKQYTGRRISLDFKDAEIDNLLRLIAEVSDLNIIAGEDVEGKVTIRLVDIPWDQALDLILLTKGLGFVRVGNVLRIAPVELIKREEEARLQERRAKEKLEDLVVKLQPVNYADVTDVEKLVQRLLTARGSVNVDERTNTIIIKDITSVIDEATALIKAIDTQTPQVMIEAKIVEANLDFSRELGAEFGFGTQPDEDFNDFTVGGTKPITIFDDDFPFNDANNIVFSNPITSTATGILNLGAFILDDRANVDFRITAAENNGEGKVISSPRVVTLDNKEATIEQGVSIPFQTFENGDAQLEFIDAVLSLTVTPHITADRSIIMEIAVSRDAPDDSVSTPTGSPAIAKNQAETEALVKDGQTLVMGGIYVVNKSDRESRTPYLHRLPILGWLFHNNLIRDIRKELLIFVTPRIVRQPELQDA